MRYTLAYHYDVLGHCPDECVDYECKRCVHDGEHNGDRCECDYQVNDSKHMGHIDLSKDEDPGPRVIAKIRDIMYREHAIEAWKQSGWAAEWPGDHCEITDGNGKPIATLWLDNAGKP